MVESNNDLIVLNGQTTLEPTSNFQATLKEIKVQVAQANDLLAEYEANPDTFVEENDEEKVQGIIDELNKVSKFNKGVEDSRKAIKKYFNDNRDEALSQLDSILNDAGLDDLQQAINSSKNLKNQMTVHRANQRWAELEEVFVQNLKQYPIIERLALQLTDFDRFRIRHAKMVSGAKTRKIGEKEKSAVNHTVYSYATNLETIESNPWGLSADDQYQVLLQFIDDPDISVTTVGSQLRAKRDAEVKAQEEARIAMEKAKAERARLEAKQEAQRQQLQAQEAERLRQEKLEAERLAQAKAAAKTQAEKERIAREEAQRKAQYEAQQAKARQEAEDLKRRQAELERQAQLQQKQLEEKLDQIDLPKSIRSQYPVFIEYVFSDARYNNIHHSRETKALLVMDMSAQMTMPNSVVAQTVNGNADTFWDLIYLVDNL